MFKSTKLTAYRIHDSTNVPQIRPGRPEREWMDLSSEHFAYRCTPLSAANSAGWEILSNRHFEAVWNGGNRKQDAWVWPLDGGGELDHLVVSHFGEGVITFHPGYLFKTDPGWALSCRGIPNEAKDGIAPLEGLVETDWLPYSFTMNWRFTRPGKVVFRLGEPFCFITPVPHLTLDDIKPEIRLMSTAPEVQAEHAAWSAARAEFIKNLDARDEATMREKWQRYYLKGRRLESETVSPTHRPKRRLAKPVVKDDPGGAKPA